HHSITDGQSRRLRSRRVGALTFNHVRFGNQRFERQQAETRATGEPFFALTFPCHGAAREMIERGGGMSITDIAMNCGFSSSSELSRQFRAEYGAAPRDFARRARMA